MTPDAKHGDQLPLEVAEEAASVPRDNEDSLVREVSRLERRIEELQAGPPTEEELADAADAHWEDIDDAATGEIVVKGLDLAEASHRAGAVLDAMGRMPEAGTDVELAGPVPAPRRESGEYTKLMEMVAAKDGPEAIEMLERLVALKERAEDRDAERAMNHALAAFKRECPPIPKDAKVDYPAKQGRDISFRHARLSTICRIIDPVLTRHGLSYTWDSEPSESQDLGRITTCRVRHIDGAERTARFHAPPSGVDKSAAVQKVGAALTYGQRYSLVQVLGLTTTMDDIDGMGADKPEDHGPPITEEHLVTLNEWLETTGGDADKFLAHLQVEKLADLPEARYEDALADIKRIGDRRGAKEAANAGTD